MSESVADKMSSRSLIAETSGSVVSGFHVLLGGFESVVGRLQAFALLME